MHQTISESTSFCSAQWSPFMRPGSKAADSRKRSNDGRRTVDRWNGGTCSWCVAPPDEWNNSKIERCHVRVSPLLVSFLYTSVLLSFTALDTTVLFHYPVHLCNFVVTGNFVRILYLRSCMLLLWSGLKVLWQETHQEMRFPNVI